MQHYLAGLLRTLRAPPRPDADEGAPRRHGDPSPLLGAGKINAGPRHYDATSRDGSLPRTAPRLRARRERGGERRRWPANWNQPRKRFSLAIYSRGQSVRQRAGSLAGAEAIDRRQKHGDFLRAMNGKKQRVLLGMSGGVDSSVAGYLLRERGYDVIGVTMKVWPQDCISRAEDKCCGPQAVADARGVAHVLGIPHYVIDEADQFEQLVINYFSSEYQAGRTPNPCVMCNEKLKFGNLWQKAEALGCDYIATGHYAIIEHHEAAAGDRGYNGRAILRKGVDPRKDQSYFLFSLRQ